MPIDTPIPSPPQTPLIGNLPQVYGKETMQQLIRLAIKYGDIYSLRLPGTKFYVVSGYDLVADIADDTKFRKVVEGTMMHLRNLGRDGLFTAHSFEDNWRRAHNILMPGFSASAIEQYIPIMVNTTKQLIRKWHRLSNRDIDVAEDMTRFALETIAQCGFTYSFHSFERDDLDPFVHAMTRAMTESIERVKRLPIQQQFAVKSSKQYADDIDLMKGTVDEIIRKRKENPELFKDNRDFLSLMLNSADRTDGSMLDAENIRFQLITFLVAGHETTSGMLAFTLYFLQENPHIWKKVQAEVDEVLGRDPDVMIDVKMLSKLQYTRQTVLESLRVWPTAPGFSRAPFEDTVIGGKYLIKKDRRCMVMTKVLHQNKEIWGQDAEVFRPERFDPDEYKKIPIHAFKPFGEGMRSCIGQHFAMVESTIVLAYLLQSFDLERNHSYKLKIAESITLKPKDFTMRVRPRRIVRSTKVSQPEAVRNPKPARKVESRPVPTHNTPLAIFYGSNMGSSEEFAKELLDQGENFGFISTLATLDEAIESLPSSGIVAIVTSTYNGLPPDNAKAFYDWLKKSQPNLAGCHYTVIGCGNTQWRTFQEVPRFIDRRLGECGAKRLLAAGEADAAKDLRGDFELWTKKFWKKTAEEYKLDLPLENAVDELFDVKYSEVKPYAAVHENFNALPFVVMDNRELQVYGGDVGSKRSTRHIVLRGPENCTYAIGDHIGIFAQNRESQIKRVCQQFKLRSDLQITLNLADQDRHSHLPLGVPISIRKILSEYVELQDLASRRHLLVMARYCKDSKEAEQLNSWADESVAGEGLYKEHVHDVNKSILSLLTQFPSCDLPFHVFLEMLNPIRPRYYSISSAPREMKNRLSITVGVVEESEHAGTGVFKGVCSNYLKSLETGEIVFGFIKKPVAKFTLPDDERPIIMIGPGTGVAPYMGFIQEMRHCRESGLRKYGEALLFFGCRRPEHDFIYRPELLDAEKNGVLRLHTAFSHVDNSEFRFVQHRIWQQKDEVWKLLEQNANIYVCGDGKNMAPDVRRCFANIYRDKTSSSIDEAEKWLTELEESGRYMVDVFGQEK